MPLTCSHILSLKYILAINDLVSGGYSIIVTGGGVTAKPGMNILSDDVKMDGFFFYTAGSVPTACDWWSRRSLWC